MKLSSATASTTHPRNINTLDGILVLMSTSPAHQWDGMSYEQLPATDPALVCFPQGYPGRIMKVWL